jgi:16S rRNA (cytosine967-C5)-methyltransferase
VWQDQAFASPALDAELSRRPDIDRRDAALATELVYGVLRTSRWLERRIAAHATGDRYKRKVVVRAHMLIAVYTMAFLERVPSFAAVSEAVKAIKQSAGTQVAGFANAVLRKLASDSSLRGADARAHMAQAIVDTVPAWLVDSIGRALGSAESARAFLLADPVPATNLCLRLGEAQSEWLERLRRALPDAVIGAGELSERSITVRGGGDPARWPGANEAWIVQEQGAQLIALAVGARPGDEVLDACAGRGNKTQLMVELVAPAGAVDAADRHPSKLARVGGPRAPRDCFAVDWTRGSGGIETSYDRILVDAPCTGVGTLRRRPEIADRLAVADPDRLAATQLAIATRLIDHLRPGGRMIYAVCSVLEPECEGVVAALCKGGRVEPCPFDSEAARKIAGDARAFRLLPHVHGTDGYFIASLRKKNGS